MSAVRAALSLSVLALAGPALAQQAPDRLNPNGTRGTPGRYHGVAVEPRGQGPGVGYGRTYFGWPLVPYYGGSAAGPALSGLGPRALSSNYPNAWYGQTAPAREETLKAEIAAREKAAREQATKPAQAKASAATVTIDFPALADMRVNGRQMPGAEKRWVLTFGPDDEGPVELRAEWTVDGQRYEWERTVNVLPNAKTRISVGAGFPIK
jgi:hypothetical protein